MGRPPNQKPDEQTLTETERDLDSILTELRGLPSDGVTIVLFDIVDGRVENLGRFPLALFSEDVVGKRFGAGRYSWKAMNANGKWIPGTLDAPTRGSFTLSAAAYDSRERILARREELAAPPRAASSAETFGVRDLMAMMTAQQLQQQAASNQLMTLVMGVVTAVIGRPAGPDPVKSLAELYAVTKPPPAVESGLGHVREVLALAREMSPTAPGDSGGELAAIAQMVTAAGPMLVPVLNRLFSAPAPMRGAVAVPPRAELPALPAQLVKAVAVNPPPPQVLEDAEMWKLQLLQYLRSLVPLAMANKTPAAYVPAFFDQVTDLGVPLSVVRAGVFDRDLLDHVKSVVPEVKTYEAWFVEFLAIIREDWDEAVADLTGKAAPGDNKGDDPPADP